MDREPFATYRTYPRGLMADGFVDGKQYAYLSVTQAKHQIPIINDAHEARVKEAVREAVEEFRERAAKVCADHYFDSLEGQGHGEALASMIRALPTEPEGK